RLFVRVQVTPDLPHSLDAVRRVDEAADLFVRGHFATKGYRAFVGIDIHRAGFNAAVSKDLRARPLHQRLVVIEQVPPAAHPDLLRSAVRNTSSNAAEEPASATQ